MSEEIKEVLETVEGEIVSEATEEVATEEAEVVTAYSKMDEDEQELISTTVDRLVEVIKELTRNDQINIDHPTVSGLYESAAKDILERNTILRMEYKCKKELIKKDVDNGIFFNVQVATDLYVIFVPTAKDATYSIPMKVTEFTDKDRFVMRLLTQEQIEEEKKKAEAAKASEE